MFKFLNPILLYLVLLLIFQVVNRKIIQKSGAWIFVGATALVLGAASYLSYHYYISWQQGTITKFLLPPYQSWHYFANYALMQFFVHYAVSFVVAVIMWALIKIANQRFQDRFMHPEEMMLFVTAIFLTGHPGWLIYLALLLGASVFLAGFHFWKVEHEERRVSLYFLWIPMAIVALLVAEGLVTNFSWLGALIFNR